MTPQEQAQLAELIAFKRSLEASYSIPKNVNDAFAQRLSIALANSTKSASSENQAVNEAGSGTYSVLKSPDLFIQTTINGVTIYIPAFT